MAKNNSITKYMGWIVIVVLSITVIKKLYKDSQSKKEIEINSAITEGEIVDYYIVGASSPYLVYKYEVEDRQYKKTTSVFAAFTGCEKTKECIGRRFVVHYSTKNPDKSEIDLEQEIE